MELQGCRVLLTGASGGIGAAIARELRRQGADLLLSARREDALRSLADSLAATIVTADLGDPESVRRLAAEAQGADVLVVCAGVDAADDLVDLAGEEIERVIAVNLAAPALLSALIAREMRERGHGHIVFISSMAGKMATAGNSAIYAATKWGLRGMALSLREELRATGVGVSAVFPGPIRDAGMFATTAVELPSNIKTNSPEEVGAAVVRAIRADVAEIDVAAPLLRLGGVLGSIAPALVAALARRQGVGEVRREMATARRLARSATRADA
jgi:short-subunit dehydrogenase